MAFFVTPQKLLYLCVVLFHFSSASEQNFSSQNEWDNESLPEIYSLEKDDKVKGTFFLRENNELTEPQQQQLQSKIFVLLVPLLCLLAFIIGLPSNLMALCLLLMRTQKLPSTILMINLTICDLLVLLVLPFRIVYHFQGNDWTFGEPFCRILVALFYGNMYGSVVCLALIALDRYIALVHPFESRTLRSYRTSLWMSLLVWIAAVVSAVPLLISKQTYEIQNLSITTCHDALPIEEQQRYFFPYFAALFAICFLIPLVVVVFCYASVIYTLLKEGETIANAIQVAGLMLVSFLICFLPSNVLLLLHYSQTDSDHLYVPYVICLSLSTFNSCIDPFIFYFVSKNFREKLCAALRCSGADQQSSGSGSRSKAALLSKQGKTETAVKGATDTQETNTLSLETL